jgi:hypothetical protein
MMMLLASVDRANIRFSEPSPRVVNLATAPPSAHHNDQEDDVAILADQDSNKKKGPGPKTAAKGAGKSATSKAKTTSSEPVTKASTGKKKS